MSRMTPAPLLPFTDSFKAEDDELRDEIRTPEYGILFEAPDLDEPRSDHYYWLEKSARALLIMLPRMRLYQVECNESLRLFPDDPTYPNRYDNPTFVKLTKQKKHFEQVIEKLCRVKLLIRHRLPWLDLELDQQCAELEHPVSASKSDRDEVFLETLKVLKTAARRKKFSSDSWHRVGTPETSPDPLTVSTQTTTTPAGSEAAPPPVTATRQLSPPTTPPTPSGPSNRYKHQDAKKWAEKYCKELGHFPGLNKLIRKYKAAMKVHCSKDTMLKAIGESEYLSGLRLEYEARRNARKGISVAAQPMNAVVMATARQSQNPDPSKVFDSDEVDRVFGRLLQTANSEERGKMNGMSDAEKQNLVRTYINSPYNYGTT